jgi:hypothetical protein
MPAVRGPVAQCHGVDTGLTAQRRTVAEMDAQGRGLGGQRQGRIPRRCQRDDMRGFVSDPGACRCQNIKCSGWRSRYEGSELVRASSVTEPHARGRPVLERGGTSREGATGPRARRNLTRGGDRSSSEAGSR